MFFTLINLIQAQQPRRISWIVWTLAILGFLAGLSMLIYFFNRLKKSDKELEEDWSLSSRSLFVEEKPAGPTRRLDEESAEAIEQQAAPQLERESPPLWKTQILSSEAVLPVATGDRIDDPAPVHTKPLVEEPVRYEAPPQEAAREEVGRAESQGEESARSGGVREERGTEMLVSERSEFTRNEVAANETTPFDNEIWAGFAASGQEPPQPQATEVEPTPEHRGEPQSYARTERRAGLERFDPPRIEPLAQREAFEPPVIEPITPRSQAALNREQQAQTTDARLKGSDYRADEPPPARISEPAPLPEPAPRPPVAEPVAAGRAARRSGSVLGLPAEVPSGPMVLGEPASPGSRNLGALTNYGKDTSPRAGHAGTIALLLVVLLVGGGVLAYLFVPSLHSRVNAIVERVRNRNQPPAQITEEPKARIIPSYKPEVNKNMVKARGVIEKITGDPLELQSLELTLVPWNASGSTEARNVAVTPDPAAPGERWLYEFEYDGNKSSGYRGYKPAKLFGSSGEVKFATPGQSR